MNLIDRYIGLVLCVLGCVFCIKSFAYPFGSLRSPGAGFFPLFFSILLVTLAIAIVVNTFLGEKGKQSNVPCFPAKGTAKNILLAILSLLVFRLFLPVIGLASTTFLFIFFLGKYLGHYDWKATGVLALTTAGLSYFIFQFLLKIPFPVGIFGL